MGFLKNNSGENDGEGDCHPQKCVAVHTLNFCVDEQGLGLASGLLQKSPSELFCCSNIQLQVVYAAPVRQR